MSAVPRTAGTMAIASRIAARLAEIGGSVSVEAQALERKIAAGTFDVAVVGQFKRGKSTLINALVGAPVLPMGVVPLTSVVTILEDGPRHACRIEFLDDSMREVDPAALPEYVTETQNPRNVKKVRAAVVRHPSRWLADGVRLIDTPGVGSIHVHNTEEAERFLPKSDAVLFVLSVEQPLAAAEVEFLREVRKHASKMFFVLNKADLLSEPERVEAESFARDALTDALGSEPLLFTLSAREALHNPAELAALTTSLRDFLTAGKGRALAFSIERQLRRTIGLARFDAQLELNSLAAPLSQLIQKHALLAAKIKEITRQRDDALLASATDRARALLAPIDAELQDFKAALATKTSLELEATARHRGDWSPRELRAELERTAIKTIRDEYDAWFSRASDTVQRQFADYRSRVGEALDRSVEEVYRYAADLFAVPFAAPQAASFEQTASRFYYKFWSEPSAIGLIAAATFSWLPASAGRRIVLRQAHVHAADMVEVQSGRLRSDFMQRLEEAVRALHRELEERTDKAVASIETAVASAMRLHKKGQAEVGSRIQRLRAVLSELDVMDREVDDHAQRPLP